ncbi:MAG: hypothetical protein WAL29_10375 [Bacteroidales bacterium]
MKTFKIIINSLLILIISGFQVMKGQADGGTVITERTDLELLNRIRLEHNMKSREEVSYENIDGDPFLYKNLVPGSLILKTGENIPLNLRYDMFKGEIQFGQKNEIYALINPENVSSVLIDTLGFIYTRYLKSTGDFGLTENSWFILNKDGKCKLLTCKNLRLQAAVPPKPYKEEGIPAKFVQTIDTYYLKVANKNAVRVNSKKDLFEYLSDKKDLLNEFIKSNKLGTKKMEDLARIVSYYNSL